MDGEFYFEESNPRKVKIILVICLIIAIAFFAVFLMLRGKHTINVKKVVTYEVGSKLNTDVAYYLNNRTRNIDDYHITFSSMLTSGELLDTIGEFDYKVTFKGVSKKGKIKVVDKSAPVVTLQKIIIGVGEKLYLEDALAKCEDYSLPCEVSFVDEKDKDVIKEAGEYQIPVTISDNKGNKTKKEIEVEIRDNYNSIQVKETDLEGHHVSVDYLEWHGEYLVKLKKGYADIGINHIDEYDEIMEALEGDLHRYLDPMYQNNGIRASEMVVIYNKYNYIIGITYYLELDNGLKFYLNK